MQDSDSAKWTPQLPITWWRPASFTKEVNPRLAKRPLVFNGRLANRGLSSLVPEAPVAPFTNMV